MHMNLHVISRFAVGTLRNTRMLDILMQNPSSTAFSHSFDRFTREIFGPTFQQRQLNFKGPVSDIVFKIDQRQLPAKHLATIYHIIVQICTYGSGVACLFEERIIQCS